MGLIHIDLFTTLDGVAQAPGGPDQDRDDGFTFGGWQTPLFDPADGERVGENLAELDALLLGRRTYEIFAGHRLQQDDEISRLFNSIPKYVASRSRPELEWEGTSLLDTDPPRAIGQLRDRHEHVRVIGSLDLVQTLLAEHLFDRLNLIVYPIVLDAGRQVFGSGAVPSNLQLLRPAETSPSGSVTLRYALAEGTPATGSVAG